MKKKTKNKNSAAEILFLWRGAMPYYYAAAIIIVFLIILFSN
tara:strand:- start:652 stop:777 length:126 start_codon:yes stop_codon:yes gene_type:complete